MALIPGIALAAPLTGSTNDNAGGIHVVPGGDDLFIANTGAEYKFDPGFHAKVLDLMREPPSDGDPGVFDGSRYYNVVIVVARDNGDGWDHDKTASHEPGGMFPAGNTTVTFVAEDSSGNAATSSVLVTVEPAVDPARGAAEGRPEPGGPN